MKTNIKVKIMNDVGFAFDKIAGDNEVTIILSNDDGTLYHDPKMTIEDMRSLYRKKYCRYRDGSLFAVLHLLIIGGFKDKLIGSECIVYKYNEFTDIKYYIGVVEETIDKGE